MLTPDERHTKELIDGLREDVRSLADALHKHAQVLEHGHTGGDSSNKQEQESRIRSIVLEQIEHERRSAEANSKKKKWTSFEKWYFAIQFLLFIATAGACAAAIWYASVAELQKTTMDGQWSAMLGQWQTMQFSWVESQKQTDAATRSADAAKSAAETAAKSLKVDQRAWLHMVIDKTGSDRECLNCAHLIVGDALFVPVVFTNSGKTPAKNARGEFILSVVPRGGEPDFIYGPGHLRNEFGAAVIFPNDDTGTLRAYALTRTAGPKPTPTILTPDMSAKIYSGEIRLILNGKVTYDDIFKVHHWLTFCTYVTTPNGAKPTPEEERRCVAHIDIDSN